MNKRVPVVIIQRTCKSKYIFINSHLGHGLGQGKVWDGHVFCWRVVYLVQVQFSLARESSVRQIACTYYQQLVKLLRLCNKYRDGTYRRQDNRSEVHAVHKHMIKWKIFFSSCYKLFPHTQYIPLINKVFLLRVISRITAEWPWHNWRMECYPTLMKLIAILILKIRISW